MKILTGEYFVNLLRYLLNGNDFVNNIVFSDEASFELGNVNRQNFRYWSNEIHIGWKLTNLNILIKSGQKYLEIIY